MKRHHHDIINIRTDKKDFNCLITSLGVHYRLYTTGVTRRKVDELDKK